MPFRWRVREQLLTARPQFIERGTLVEDLSLDQLRESYRRITMGFTAPPPEAELHMPGIRRVRRGDRQLCVLASGKVDAIAERGRSMSAVSVDIAPIGLRELFLESVKADP